MNNETNTIEEKILMCESARELDAILSGLKTQQQEWKKKINQIIKDAKLPQNEIAEICGVSKMSVSKWRKGSVPRNRETFIRLGFAAGYQMTQMNELLVRYGRFPGLHPKSLEDCICIYVLKYIDSDNAKRRCDVYLRLLEEIKAEITNCSECDIDCQTDKLIDELALVSDTDSLKAFVRDNAMVFKRTYNKLYAFVKAFLYANSSCVEKNDIHININKLANQQNWSASLRKCVYAINMGNWYPTRNKIISLGLHLNMDYDEVNEMLSLAHMENLSVKNPFELAIIYILKEAEKNNIVITDGSDRLCKYAKSVLKQLSIPEAEEFLSEL